MFLAFHYPFFGSSTVDCQIMRCPVCPQTSIGVSDWQERDISKCDPGDKYVCNKCGNAVIINWGLMEPDHLSKWISSEYCEHRLCKIKYKELCKEKGWTYVPR